MFLSECRGLPWLESRYPLFPLPLFAGAKNSHGKDSLDVRRAPPRLRGIRGRPGTRYVARGPVPGSTSPAASRTRASRPYAQQSLRPTPPLPHSSPTGVRGGPAFASARPTPAPPRPCQPAPRAAAARALLPPSPPPPTSCPDTHGGAGARPPRPLRRRTADPGALGTGPHAPRARRPRPKPPRLAPPRPALLDTGRLLRPCSIPGPRSPPEPEPGRTD